VTSSPTGISCGPFCTHTFVSGTTVTLTAAAGPGSTFDGWSGGGCAGANPCSLTVSSDASVGAGFAAVPVPALSAPASTPAGKRCKKGRKLVKRKGKARCLKRKRRAVKGN
jgi:hypothetical protein